jgi:squalene synthase HpnC
VRGFARQYSENFTIASWLLGPRRRDEYLALYAFARGADQLSDEISRELDPDERALARLAALDEWQIHLDSLFSGAQPVHPAFVALGDVINRRQIEPALFYAMIEAFRQDQTVSRYDTWEELRQYTRGSADPVGRWVLRLHGLRDPRLDALSDAVCTALQIVNFIQDIREDLLEDDRVYLPRELLHKHGVSEEMLAQRPTPAPVRKALAEAAERTERLFALGRPLLKQAKGALQRQLILFHGGGRAALHAVRKADYDVNSKKVKVGSARKVALLGRALRGRPL